MVDSPSLTLAFVAGLASFLSPCCLPLVPGYLAAVFGHQDAQQSAAARSRVIARSGAFVTTFSLLFIAFGLTATVLGRLLFDSQPVLNKVGGGAMILMGAIYAASPFTARLGRQWKIAALTTRASTGGSPIIAGAAFAIAWTPCVGPTLGAILGLAATTTGTGQGATLLAVYSAGLALPFLLCAAAYGRALATLTWFKRHYAAIQLTSGLLLAAMGVLVFTGELFRLNIAIQEALDGLGLNFWQSL